LKSNNQLSLPANPRKKATRKKLKLVTVKTNLPQCQPKEALHCSWKMAEIATMTLCKNQWRKTTMMSLLFVSVPLCGPGAGVA